MTWFADFSCCCCCYCGRHSITTISKNQSKTYIIFAKFLALCHFSILFLSYFSFTSPSWTENPLLEVQYLTAKVALFLSFKHFCHFPSAFSILLILIISLFVNLLFSFFQYICCFCCCWFFYIFSRFLILLPIWSIWRLPPAIIATGDYCRCLLSFPGI